MIDFINLGAIFGIIPPIIWQCLMYTVLTAATIKLLQVAYLKYLRPHVGPWLKWGNQTALLLGWPMLLILLFTCMTKLTFTASCLSVGEKCQYALGVSDMAQKYLTNLVGGESEIIVSPKKGA